MSTFCFGGDFFSTLAATAAGAGLAGSTLATGAAALSGMGSGALNAACSDSTRDFSNATTASAPRSTTYPFKALPCTVSNQIASRRAGDRVMHIHRRVSGYLRRDIRRRVAFGEHRHWRGGSALESQRSQKRDQIRHGSPCLSVYFASRRISDATRANASLRSAAVGANTYNPVGLVLS